MSEILEKEDIIKQAKQLIGRGEIKEAEELLEFAASYSNLTVIDVRDLLERLIKEVQCKK